MVAALVFVAWIESFLGIFGPHQEVVIPQDSVKVEYACQPHQWIQAPKVDDSGMLNAKLAVTCEFLPLARGGYAMLNQYLLDRVHKDSTKIYDGPLNVTYKGIPAVFYDVDYPVSQGSDRVDARQAVYIGHENQKRVIFDTVSKEIRGSGMVSYVKAISMETQVQDGTKSGTHSLTALVSTQIEKPWFVGAKTLENEIKTRTEKELPNLQKKLIDDLAQHI